MPLDWEHEVFDLQRRAFASFRLDDLMPRLPDGDLPTSFQGSFAFSRNRTFSAVSDGAPLSPLHGSLHGEATAALDAVGDNPHIAVALPPAALRRRPSLHPLDHHLDSSLDHSLNPVASPSSSDDDTALSQETVLYARSAFRRVWARRFRSVEDTERATRHALVTRILLAHRQACHQGFVRPWLQSSLVWAAQLKLRLLVEAQEQVWRQGLLQIEARQAFFLSEVSSRFLLTGVWDRSVAELDCELAAAARWAHAAEVHRFELYCFRREHRERRMLRDEQEVEQQLLLADHLGHVHASAVDSAACEMRCFWVQLHLAEVEARLRLEHAAHSQSMLRRVVVSGLLDIQAQLWEDGMRQAPDPRPWIAARQLQRRGKGSMARCVLRNRSVAARREAALWLLQRVGRGFGLRCRLLSSAASAVLQRVGRGFVCRCRCQVAAAKTGAGRLLHTVVKGFFVRKYIFECATTRRQRIRIRHRSQSQSREPLSLQR